MDQAARGAAALAASNYDEAIKHYTDAITSNPAAVDYYIKRSTAFQRSSKYAEALSDAETAVVLAHKRAKRELIKDAQLRRAIALFFVGEYANAQHIINVVKKLDSKEKTLAIWEAKIAGKLKDVPEDDDKRKVTVQDVPDIEVPMARPPQPKPVADESTKTNAAPAIPTLPSNVKPKHDWYQTNDTVTFNLLVKNVPKDRTTVEIEKDSLSVTYPVVDGKEFTYDLLPFYAEVDPTASKYRITPTKIEVTLKKAVPGTKWSALEGELKNEPAAAAAKESSPNTTTFLPSRPAGAAPAYPTSSKNGPKNWDTITDGELGEDDMAEGDETTRFFKTLYKGATPEAQRAMMKSYQESGGTVLSTDWSNVGNKFVAPEPPEGMEAKQY